MFLHGWGGNMESFIGIAREFFKTNRVILVDFEHFSDSEVRTLDYYVEEVRRILILESVEDAYFICHSFGGRVGVRFAKKYPRNLRGLVLIDSAGLKPIRGIRYHFRVILHKFLKKLHLNGLKGSSDFRQLTKVQKQTFVNVVNDFTEKDLPYINKPTLILWGSKDRDTPIYMAFRYKRKIKQSTLKIFYGAGHFSYLDRIVETTSAIKTYIANNERRISNS